MEDGLNRDILEQHPWGGYFEEFTLKSQSYQKLRYLMENSLKYETLQILVQRTSCVTQHWA